MAMHSIVRNSAVFPAAPLQARSSSRPQARAAFRAPARALYFHTRQSIIAMAAEVSTPGLHMRRRLVLLPLLPLPCAPLRASDLCTNRPPVCPQTEEAAEAVEEEFVDEVDEVPSSVSATLLACQACKQHVCPAACCSAGPLHTFLPQPCPARMRCSLASSAAPCPDVPWPACRPTAWFAVFMAPALTSSQRRACPPAADLCREAGQAAGG